MLRTLIVDDEELSGRLVANSLRAVRIDGQSVFDVELASTPETATLIVRATDQPFDVFLIDVELHARMDGIQLMQELRRLSPDSDAIVFTGDEAAESGQRAVELGAYRFLAMPYNPRDIVWNLRTLEQHRRVRRERDWLRILGEIAESSQRVETVREVAKILVLGGHRLGFERARIWQVTDGGAELRGICQAGSPELEPFTEQSITVRDSAYAKRSIEAAESAFFAGAEWGALDIEKCTLGLFRPPKGEWAQIPLRSGENVFALLSLDNAELERRLSSDERMLLKLFGEQAAVALSRAQIFELEQKKSRNLEILNEIAKRVTSRSAEDLDGLLWEVRAQVSAFVDVTNFMVALCDDEIKKLDFRLQVEDGHKRARHWASLDSGLIGHVIQINESRFLPSGSRNYRREHNIKLVGRPSKSWLGVPLRVADKAIGAIAVQSYVTEDAFSQEDQQLLTAVADTIAGAIQAAWVREKEMSAAQRLAVLQQFGAEFMQLAEDSELLLWHALCTAASAEYGLRFNRVAIFMRVQDSLELVGKIGVGHFRAKQAYRAWTRDRKRGFNAKTYFADLRAGALNATPVEKSVANMVLNTDIEKGAIKAVLEDGRRRIVTAGQAELLLPRAFVDVFGCTDYAIIPIKTGKHPSGVMIVDNIHNQKPLSSGSLDDLETVIDLAALIFENVRQRDIRDRVVRPTMKLLAKQPIDLFTRH